MFWRARRIQREPGEPRQRAFGREVARFVVARRAVAAC